jgi:hypothetical protein
VWPNCLRVNISALRGSEGNHVSPPKNKEITKRTHLSMVISPVRLFQAQVQTLPSPWRQSQFESPAGAGVISKSHPYLGCFTKNYRVAAKVTPNKPSTANLVSLSERREYEKGAPATAPVGRQDLLIPRAGNQLLRSRPGPASVYACIGGSALRGWGLDEQRRDSNSRLLSL